MTEILSGTVLAKAIRERVTDVLRNSDHPPGLAVILVGDNPASHLYVKLKEEAAREAGIYVEKIVLEKTTTKKLQSMITALNDRPDIHGILIQLPLPKGIDTDAVTSHIAPEKDVDGFHAENIRTLNEGTIGLVPPVALAVMRLIEATRQPLRHRKAVIICNSTIFAEPILHLLHKAGVRESTVLQRDTPQFAEIVHAADIIIVAVGVANFLTPSMIKDSAVVIDVGTNRTTEGKVVGDASPDLLGHAGFLSKVPGGVGPLTVAYLLENVVTARTRQEATKHKPR